MARRGDSMQLVEILDQPIDAAADPDPPQRRGRRRWWLVLGAAAVLLGAFVAQSVLDARERAAVAALAELPGVVAPVDEHLTIVRTLSKAEEALLGSGGLLTGAGDGSQTFTWPDPKSGEVAWSTRLLGPTPSLEYQGEDVGQVQITTTCQPNGARPEDTRDVTRVVCLVSDGGVTFDPDSGEMAEVPATTTRVVVLDSADGAVLRSWPVDSAVSLAVLEDSAVVASVVDGAPVVTAYAMQTGEALWASTLPGEAESDAPDGGNRFWVSRAGDRVSVQLPGRMLLLSADGRVLRDIDLADGRGGGWMVEEHTGRLLYASGGGDGGGSTTTLVSDGDASTDHVLDGDLVYFGINDGSIPGLILTSGGRLYAWDAATGRKLWESDVAGTVYEALALRGRVFVVGAGGATRIDGRTGESVWTVPVPSEMGASNMFTDGQHLLLSFDGYGTSPSPVLVALDLNSGEEAFRAPLPAGVNQVFPGMDHRLIGHTDQGRAFVVLQ